MVPKDKKTKKKILYVVLAVALFAAAVSGIQGYNKEEAAIVNGKNQEFNEGWIYNGEEITFPRAFRANEGSIKLSHLMNSDQSGLTIELNVNNAMVEVECDGNIIYRSQLQSGVSPEANNAINLPEYIEGGKLIVTLTPINALSNIYARHAYIMRRDVSVMKHLKGSLLQLLCCIFMLLSALLILVTRVIKKYSGWNEDGVAWLSLVGFAAAIYCLAVSGTPAAFFGNDQVFLMLGGTALVTIPALLVGWSLSREKESFWRLIYPLSIILAATGAVLHIIPNLPSIPLDIGAAALMAAIAAYGIKESYPNKNIPIILANIFLMGFGVTSVATSLSLSIFTVTGLNSVFLTLFMGLSAYHELSSLVFGYVEAAEKNEKEAIRASEAKGKFLANMSHEIRTPINAVIGMDEMILRRSKDDEIRGYASDIYAAGQSLLSVINDILDISKIEAGKMEIILGEYDTTALIHDAVNMVKPRVASKDIIFECNISNDIPKKLYGDENRIRQTMINLLNNAVKYTNSGNVWFNVKWKKTGENDGVMRVEVKATGSGIKKRDLPKLFSEYGRIDENLHRNTEGTGLGLSITIKMLKMMNSTLKVKTKYGKGTYFWYELPQKIIDPTPMGDFETAEKTMAGRYEYTSAGFVAPEAKILVVDDNELNLKVFTSLLADTKAEIVCAASGYECLKLYKEEHFDLIFLDHMMPGMDGMETLAEMKKHLNSPSYGSPVFALTANAVAGAKEMYLDAGFDGFISKPVSSVKLEQIVRDNLPSELLQNAPSGKTEQTEDTGDLSSIPDIEGIDKEYGILHFGNVELYKTSAKDFFRAMDNNLLKISEAYEGLPEDEAVGLYRTEVHGLKGAALAIGAFQVGGLARTLEIYAKNNDIISIYTLHPLFLDECEKLKKSMEPIYGTSAEKHEASLSEIKALLMMISSSMEVGDIDGADSAIEKLKTCILSADDEEYMATLETAVTDIDTDEVVKVCNIWQESLKKRKE